MHLVFRNSDLAVEFRLKYDFKLDERKYKVADAVFWHTVGYRKRCDWINEHI